MPEVTLIINTGGDTTEVPVTADVVTIGRGDDAVVVIDDAGLSRLHASIHCEGEEVWLVDENSTNGTRVNDEEAPPGGIALRDGDEISIGDETTITVQIEDSDSVGTDDRRSSPATLPRSNSFLPPPAIIALMVAAIIGIGGVLALGIYAISTGDSSNTAQPSPGGGSQTAQVTPTQNIIVTPSPVASPVSSPVSLPSVTPSINTVPPGGQQTGVRLYRDMNDEEQRNFIADRARHISQMMAQRPYEFNEVVIGHIKRWVDVFAGRVGSNSTRMWASDMRVIYHRGACYAPMISRSFAQEGVPPVVGIYLPVIETEYHNVNYENVARAKGLFQFIPATARGYGIDPDQRTNVPVMAGAAARHIRDNMIQFGDDSMSVAMAIAGYNRAVGSLLRDFRTVLSTPRADGAARERNFWTLIANERQLDNYFQHENRNYVPRWFAAAIIGENPWAFDLRMNPLSTYTTDQTTTPSQTPCPNDSRPAS